MNAYNFKWLLIEKRPYTYKQISLRKTQLVLPNFHLSISPYKVMIYVKLFIYYSFLHITQSNQNLLNR
jgi:hypothetical protein